MNRHPGGIAATETLLAHAKLLPGIRLLDLGAGDGETVRFLRREGFLAEGIDREPGGPEVKTGDFLNLPYEEESFDACISQCAFLVSGDPERALSQAYRVLKPGGALLLSDVHPGNLKELMKQAGFTLVWERDITGLWKEYYLEAIWTDSCCGEYEEIAARYKGQKLFYHQLVGRKE